MTGVDESRRVSQHSRHHDFQTDTVEHGTELVTGVGMALKDIWIVDRDKTVEDPEGVSKGLLLQAVEESSLDSHEHLS